MDKQKYCVLTPSQLCNDCGECKICDLDPNKICDNCFKCIETDWGFARIDIDKIILDEDETNQQH